jgi:hypothetical protein
VEKVKALGIDTSIGRAVEHDLHRKRRESLHPFLKKSVLNLTPQVQLKAAQLGVVSATSLQQKEIINLSDIYFGFSREQVMTSRKKDAYLSDWKQPGFAVLFWSQSECSWQYTPSSTHAAQCYNRSPWC